MGTDESLGEKKEVLLQRCPCKFIKNTAVLMMNAMNIFRGQSVIVALMKDVSQNLISRE